jgi:hypothetical protein
VSSSSPGSSQELVLREPAFFTLSLQELAAWRGNRGDAGRVKPERFLTNPKFGRRVENGKDNGKDANDS